MKTGYPKRTLRFRAATIGSGLLLPHPFQLLRPTRIPLQNPYRRTRRKSRVPQSPKCRRQILLFSQKRPKLLAPIFPLEKSLNQIRFVGVLKSLLGDLLGELRRNAFLTQLAQHAHLSEALVLQPRRREILGEPLIVQITDFPKLGEHNANILSRGSPPAQLLP